MAEAVRPTAGHDRGISIPFIPARQSNHLNMTRFVRDVFGFLI